ncbi:MAG: hypothetical protein CMF69_11495 [Magnetovibrio sp.]|nr:hypothetical protein [Magnetovibrio sp.]
MKYYIQLVLSAILGFAAEICYLLTSFLIDKTKSVSIYVSNFIGLMVDVILDFILQSLLFLGFVSIQPAVIFKFIIFRIFDTFIRQILYVFSMKFKFVQKYIHNQPPKDDNNPIPEFLRYRHSHIRYLIILICFFILTFPLRKYFVFVKSTKL